MVNKQSASKGLSKKMLVALLAICMSGVLLLIGCSKKDDGKKEDTTPKSIGTVAITVDITAAVDLKDPTALVVAEEKGGSTYTVEVKIYEGDTVLIATQAAEDLLVSVATNSYGKYIDSIDGLVSGGTTSESGWTFTINGEFSDTGADTVKLVDGDEIIWTYVTSWE